jgi:hypothetical protein
VCMPNSITWAGRPCYSQPHGRPARATQAHGWVGRSRAAEKRLLQVWLHGKRPTRTLLHGPSLIRIQILLNWPRTANSTSDVLCSVDRPRPISGVRLIWNANWNKEGLRAIRYRVNRAFHSFWCVCLYTYFDARPTGLPPPLWARLGGLCVIGLCAFS